MSALKSDKHNFYSGNETWKKYISNHYNNLICVSITLTNIYLTYKREIIVHIKLMVTAVTYMVQSDGVVVTAESSCSGVGARGAICSQGGHSLALCCGHRPAGRHTLAHSNTGSSRRPPRCPKGTFRLCCRKMTPNTTRL